MAARDVRTRTPGSFDPRKMKRRCIAATIVAAVCLVAFVGSARRSIGFFVGSARIGLSTSALVVGQAPISDPPVFNSYWMEDWYADYGNAWRPFHATTMGAHVLIIPLWQPMLLAAIVAAHAWGVLRGARHADPHRCRGCGYSLIGLPENAEQRCPECGRALETG